ncbi:MAG: pyrroline-5-carboxylate reductase [Acidobacteriota bacterium]
MSQSDDVTSPNVETTLIDSLAILGAGKMGETLVSALLRTGAIDPASITMTATHESRLERVADLYGVSTTRDNVAAAKDAAAVLLCVKPQIAPRVLEEIAPVVGPEQPVISIVAGLTTAMMEDRLAEGVPVVRAMPNTPSRICSGMTAICGGRHATKHHIDLSQALFRRIGRAMVLDETYFDAVTGLSASGPAFIYVVIEALAEGGVKVGLPRQVATELAAQTCLGAANLVIETGHHPALLKDEVTTPAGCTVDGLLELEAGGLRVTLIKAVVEAARRARELVDESEERA